MSWNNSAAETIHPCTRWFEWNGGKGVVTYYDKETKKNVEVGNDFTFLVLDSLAVIKGWHDPSDSAITSNEIRDSRKETFLVKSFKGGVIANGLYSNIRDKVAAAGGSFNTNLYIAVKKDGVLSICSLRLKGAALNAWVEFQKANRSKLGTHGVKIKGANQGKKGSITFYTPKFSLVEVTPQTDSEASGLQIVLQNYLTSYFARHTDDAVGIVKEQTQEIALPAPETIGENRQPEEDKAADGEQEEDDIPF